MKKPQTQNGLPTFIGGAAGNDKMIATVKFEDKGQDFLQFKIEFYPDYMLGYVVECTPAQSSVWVGMCVLSDKPKKGGYITVSKSPSDNVVNIKYKITDVKIERATPAKKKAA